MTGLRIFVALIVLVVAGGMRPINSPYPDDDREANVLYRSITREVTKMDPATYYSGLLIFDVLEPPFEYHLLKRPHELIPLTAKAIPRAEERLITVGDREVEAIVYRVEIKKGIMYQDHPCFVPANHDLAAEAFRGLAGIRDLAPMGTRELKAEDFVLGACRLADPRLSCPIYNILEKNMLGLAEYKQRIETELERARAKRKGAAGITYNRESDERYDPIPIDYIGLARGLPFVKETGPYSYEVTLKHPYPQILAWMTFSFFAPVPREALDFYSQRVVLEQSFNMNNDMIGTGPYVLKVSDPIHQVVLVRNTNYRHDVYPGLPKPDPGDAQAVTNYGYMERMGMLRDCGRKIPFIDKIVFRMEKESIPRWNKFIQGYYDESRVEGELFDETVKLSSKGGSVLTSELRSLGIRMVRATPAITSWIAFNMTDNVVGGYAEDKCRLRQALSIAYDSEEAIDLLNNGIGIPAQNIIPPGIFGQTPDRAGMNKYVYNWDDEQNRPVRKPIEEARRLLAEAGYADGVGKDGRPLVLDYMIGSMNPKVNSQITFLRRQFEKINVELTITLVDTNRFHKNREAARFQMCGGGWLADYPDPENFLFLYNASKPGTHENKTGFRYYRTEYNRLYVKMQGLPDSPERLAVIREMLEMLSHDAPSIFRMHPVGYSLYHSWVHNALPDFRTGKIKYLRIDPGKRRAYRDKQNQPQWKKAAVFVLALIGFAVPAVLSGVRQFRRT